MQPKANWQIEFEKWKQDFVLLVMQSFILEIGPFFIPASWWWWQRKKRKRVKKEEEEHKDAILYPLSALFETHRKKKLIYILIHKVIFFEGLLETLESSLETDWLQIVEHSNKRLFPGGRRRRRRNSSLTHSLRHSLTYMHNGIRPKLSVSIPARVLNFKKKEKSQDFLLVSRL